MKKRLMLLSMLAALGASPSVLAVAVPPSVEVQRAAALRNQGGLLLDVREPAEFAEVHAQGARLIPLGQLPTRLHEIAQYKSQPVAVICRSGRRSAQAVDVLRNAGFSQVTNVEGGTNAWLDAGLPVVRK